MSILTITQFTNSANDKNIDLIMDSIIITTGQGMSALKKYSGVKYLCEASDLYSYITDDPEFDGEFRSELVFESAALMNARG